MWVCDTRERDLIPLLSNIPTRNLPVGDIWIGLSGENVLPGGLVIERKAVADLEASIKDGRYREQRLRLLTHCQETGARPLYIIEGNLDRLNATRFQGNTLRKFLHRLQIRYGVPVIQTESLEGTANICSVLLDQWQTDKTVFVVEDGAKKDYAASVTIHKRGNKEDPAVFASMVLQQCPGVSAAIAKAILEKGSGGGLTGTWALSEKDLAAVQVTAKRKVGPALAKRLWTLLHCDSPQEQSDPPPEDS
jgi:ERCC4-type nuclease